MTKNHYIKLAEITGAHGVHGRVCIRSFTEQPEDFTAYGPLTDAEGKKTFTLRITGTTRGQFIAEIEGVTRREQAEVLRGTGFYAARGQLKAPKEEGRYLIADLIGLSVVLEDGMLYGVVSAVRNYGAGDLIEIEKVGGKETELQVFTQSNFPSINIKNKQIIYRPPIIFV